MIFVLFMSQLSLSLSLLQLQLLLCGNGGLNLCPVLCVKDHSPSCNSDGSFQSNKTVSSPSFFNLVLDMCLIFWHGCCHWTTAITSSSVRVPADQKLWMVSFFFSHLGLYLIKSLPQKLTSVGLSWEDHVDVSVMVTTMELTVEIPFLVSTPQRTG